MRKGTQNFLFLLICYVRAQTESHHLPPRQSAFTRESNQPDIDPELSSFQNCGKCIPVVQAKQHVIFVMADQAITCKWIDMENFKSLKLELPLKAPQLLSGEVFLAVI